VSKRIIGVVAVSFFVSFGYVFRMWDELNISRDISFAMVFPVNCQSVWAFPVEDIIGPARNFSNLCKGDFELDPSLPRGIPNGFEGGLFAMVDSPPSSDTLGTKFMGVWSAILPNFNSLMGATKAHLTDVSFFIIRKLIIPWTSSLCIICPY
jgi:hypothetical protein